MKIAIYGYGNLGRGVECAVQNNPDMELVAIFTRRAPATVQPLLPGTPVISADDVLAYEGKIDVMILCGGSATDLPVLTPALAAHFHVIDSFDTHAAIPAHFAAVDRAALETGHLALISAGWDPGLFSLARLYATAALPNGKDYTFWGPGISQGHSDAIRRIPGVLDARQYTVPVDEALSAVRAGETNDYTTAQKHHRVCYVVAEEGADRDEIEKRIKTMPNYFADYETSVTFVTREALLRDHGGMPHGGSVIRNGKSGLQNEHTNTIEFRLALDSNPEFTAGVLVACARAVCRMAARGSIGCKTLFDVAPADLFAGTAEELRAHLL